MKIWAECAGVDSILARQEVFIIRSDSDQSQIEDFGLTLEEGKGVSRQAQAEHTQIQVEQSGIINRSISRLETLRRRTRYLCCGSRPVLRMGFCHLCRPPFLSAR